MFVNNKILDDKHANPKPGTFIANAKIMSQQSAMKKEGREKIQ